MISGIYSYVEFRVHPKLVIKKWKNGGFGTKERSKKVITKCMIKDIYRNKERQEDILR